MKKEDVRVELAELKGEFKIIKKLIYIIIAALIGLLVKAFWTSIVNAPTIVGNVIKEETYSQGNITLALSIVLVVMIIAGLIMIKKKEKK